MAKDLSGRRIVVVSPHSDDGVLSLGAAMASWARRGADVELLTVLALDPESDAPAGGWDARAGFGTEGEAAVARRDEDRQACAILGATPAWLPFGSVDYERHGDEDDVIAAVEPRLATAQVALAPGFPLSHPDHAWLTRALVESQLRDSGLCLYVEQPYASRASPAAEARPPDWLGDDLSRMELGPLPVSARARLAKLRAVRCYRSQLPLLGLGPGRSPLLRLLWSELRSGGERAAFPSGTDVEIR